MRYFILIIALFLPSFVTAKQKIDWPDTKYQPEECIVPTNINWSWYGKYAYVVDVVFSKNYEQFVYVLHINDTVGTGLFGITQIENNTAKLSACPK